jgi:hypothetical protein
MPRDLSRRTTLPKLVRWISGTWRGRGGKGTGRSWSSSTCGILEGEGPFLSP